MPGEQQWPVWGLSSACSFSAPSLSFPPLPAGHLPLPEVFSCAHTPPLERVYLLGSVRPGAASPSPGVGCAGGPGSRWAPQMGNHTSPCAQHEL